MVVSKFTFSGREFGNDVEGTSLVLWCLYKCVRV